MKRMYQVMALIGALIWVATLFLRGTAFMDNSVIDALLGVAPNFGSFWLAFGLCVAVYPFLFRQEFNFKYVWALTGIIFAAVLLSEVIHFVFLSAGFDVWDMVSSLIAAVGVLLAKWVYQKATV